MKLPPPPLGIPKWDDCPNLKQPTQNEPTLSVDFKLPVDEIGEPGHCSFLSLGGGCHKHHATPVVDFGNIPIRILHTLTVYIG